MLVCILLCSSKVSANDEQRPFVQPYLKMPHRFPLQAGDWCAVNAFPNLTFHNATWLTSIPGSDRLIVCEREGMIKSFRNDASATNTTTVLDLRQQCQGEADCGLLGLVFHPDFGKADSVNRGYFYVAYNFSKNPDPRPKFETTSFNRLSRFTMADDGIRADIKSELVLIDQFDQGDNHNGGSMFFHPEDGFLYLSLGDEGIVNGELGNYQRLDEDLFSGVIRIDVNKDERRSHPPRRQPRTGKTANYYIPNDNPFVGVPGVLEEFWCLGLRSPHRMCYDAISNRTWLADVGFCTEEEVNLIVKAGNYQWNYAEGKQKTTYSQRPARIIGVEQKPVYSYPRTEGNYCVIGGVVYRGAEWAELQGKYVFGDHGSGRIWSLTYSEGKAAVVKELCRLPVQHQKLNSFGTDAQGEVYMCALGDAPIFKLIQVGREPPLEVRAPIPATLSQTGAFADVRTLTPSPGLLPYMVNCPSFSDHALKQRWMALPTANKEKIEFAPKGEWKFPAGAVFIKHFDIALTATETRRLETRLLVCDSLGAVYGATYRWRPDNSDADLLTNGLQEILPTGQTWSFPSPAECLTCHNANAGYVLGVNARQLNCPANASGPPTNQLVAWNKLGVFGSQISEEELARCARLVDIHDRTASVQDRALSYLDANCSYCHRPHGVRGTFDARLESSLRYQGLVNGAVFDPSGIVGAMVIAPGDPERSLLLQRLKSCDKRRMPPLSRNVVDDIAVEVFEDWIRQLLLTKYLIGLCALFAAVTLLGMAAQRRIANLSITSGNVVVRYLLVNVMPFLLVASVPIIGSRLLRELPYRYLPSAACCAVLFFIAMVLFFSPVKRQPRLSPPIGQE